MAKALNRAVVRLQSRRKHFDGLDLREQMSRKRPGSLNLHKQHGLKSKSKR